MNYEEEQELLNLTRQNNLLLRQIVYHLQDDICNYYKLPTQGELASIISGDIAMAMYKGFIKYLNYA